MSHNVQIVNISPPIFAQLTLLPSPQNLMLYNASQLARHPKKCPFKWRHLHSHVIHVP